MVPISPYYKIYVSISTSGTSTLVKHYLQIVLFGNYLIENMTVLPTQDCLSSSNSKFVCCKICSYSQVASLFGTPSFAPSALLWFCSLIFFSYNLSSGTHVLQFCVPKCKEMWIMHIDISFNITTNTKRINQIHKNQICTNNLYLHILETFSEISPLFASV